MNGNTLKKIGAISVGIVLILVIALVIVSYAVLGLPTAAIAVEIIAGAIVCIVTLYEVKVRLKEIEEGLEDAVDNY